MAEITHRTVRTNGVDLHVAESGPRDGVPVILCHGFPELWYSWRHQLPALGDAGYHAIAPDQHGYGHSEVPPNVGDYGIRQLTGDLLGLLDETGHETGVFVGHDWGALIVWDMARLHPDRCLGVCAMSVPFFNPPVPPTELFESLSQGNFFYILYFQEVGPAEEEMGHDPGLTMSRILWSASAAGTTGRGLGTSLPRAGTGFLDTMSDMPELPAWLTQEDLDYFTAEFAHSGFFGGVSYYRNLDANWNLVHGIDPSEMTMPIAFVAGKQDPVIAMGGVGAMEATLPNFRGSTLIDGAGHWNQQEKPQETTDALLAFLRGL